MSFQVKRIYYGLHSVSVTAYNPCFPSAGSCGSLMQSVGINASTEYEQVFELGRVGIYANIEGIPTAEVTVERAMTIETFGRLWTLGGGSGSGAAEKIDNTTYTINMGIRPEGGCSATSASGFVQCNGAVLSSYTMNFGTDGPLTESATFIGNQIGWTSGVPGLTETDPDEPPSGIVLNRQHVIGGGPFATNSNALQSASFSISLDREDVVALGDRFPVLRPINFPIEATAEFEYLAGGSGTTYGLSFNPDEAGGQVPGGVAGQQPGVWLGVRIPTGGGGYGSPKYIYLEKAFLTSSNYSGGDAGGGNATISHSYTNYEGLGVNSSLPSNINGTFTT